MLTVVNTLWLPQVKDLESKSQSWASYRAMHTLWLTCMNWSTKESHLNFASWEIHGVIRNGKETGQMSLTCGLMSWRRRLMLVLQMMESSICLGRTIYQITREPVYASTTIWSITSTHSTITTLCSMVLSALFSSSSLKMILIAIKRLFQYL